MLLPPGPAQSSLMMIFLRGWPNAQVAARQRNIATREHLGVVIAEEAES
jgi:hypothetical protein